MPFPIHIERDKPLRPFSTFKIGGAARYFVSLKHLDELPPLVDWARSKSIPYCVIGNGSNVLFADEGFNGLIIHNKISFVRQEGGVFCVGAGYSFSRLGLLTARLGFKGLEFATGIPGSVGGAIFMNAGAYGGEVKDRLVKVTYIDAQGKCVEKKREALQFTYRSSPFHTMKGVVIASATFSLLPCKGARKNQIEMIKHRIATQPSQERSCGCMFRNPTPISAGALIDRCGLKKLYIGGAIVSERHANYIVNRGGATAQDVLQLIQLVKSKVKEKTGLHLKTEVRVIPYNMI